MCLPSLDSLGKSLAFLLAGVTQGAFLYAMLKRREVLGLVKLL